MLTPEDCNGGVGPESGRLGKTIPLGSMSGTILLKAMETACAIMLSPVPE